MLNSNTHSRHRTRMLLLISLFTIFVTSTLSLADHTTPSRRVLVLHENADASAGRMAFSNEFFRLMRENPDYNVNVTFEFLGLNLLDENEVPAQAIEALQNIAENQTIDVVLSLLPRANDFLLTYGETLFPDTPKVFVLPQASSMPEIAQLPRSAVVASSSNSAIQQTVTDIFSILPDTQRLIVVSGATSTDLSYVDRAQQIIPDIVSENVRVEFLVGLPYPALEAQVIAQPENTAILLLLYEGDTDGNDYQFSEVSHNLSLISPVPIFSFIQLDVADGVIGGTVGTMELYAQSTADLVFDILDHPDTETYGTVVEADTVTVYDANQLNRWGIPYDRIGDDSLIINHEPTFWEMNRDLIAIAIIIITIESLLILTLIISRRRRVRAEASLKTSEGRFRAIFDNSSDAIGVSLKGKHVFVNSAYREIFGIAPDYNLLGTPVLDYIAPTEHERITAYIRSRVTDNQAPTIYETRGKRVDGQEFDMEVRLSTFPMDDGIYSVVFLRDISERKAHEEVRRIGEERLQALGNALPDPVMLVTREGVLLDVYTSNAELLTPEMQSLKDRSLYALIDDSRLDEFQIYVERAFNEQKIQIFEYELDVIAGKHWFEGRIVPMPGKIDGDELVLMIARDITERKRSDDLLQARLRLSDYAIGHSVTELLQKSLDEAEVLTQSTIGFYHLIEEDQKTILLTAWSSNTLENMCQVVGGEVHYPLDQAGVWAEAVRKQDTVIHNDFRTVENKRGLPEGHAPVNCEVVVPIKRNDRIVAIVGVGNKHTAYTKEDVNILYQIANMSWDIISGLKAQISLKQNEEILALKDQFITMISHEFRTPMAVIQTSSDMLKNYYDRMSEERKKQLLMQISEQVHHMTEMVTNTLTMSKSQRGIIEFVPAPLDVENFSKRMLNQVKLIDSVKHNFNCEISLQDKEVVLDATLLEHIVLNLLLNATKYTPENGDVSLLVSDDAEHLTLSIKDTGIGIPEDALENLFDSFYRAPNVGNIQGTGLGLAIVRQFTEMHHGTISVESEQGVGSTFTITLPKNIEPVQSM